MLWSEGKDKGSNTILSILLDKYLFRSHCVVFPFQVSSIIKIDIEMFPCLAGWLAGYSSLTLSTSLLVC